MKLKIANIFNRAGKGEIVFTLHNVKQLPHQNFYDQNKNLLGFVRGQNVIIYDNYIWNGCSPRVWLYEPLNISIGTPNGKIVDLFYYKIDEVIRSEKMPQTAHASLLHDFLCQFTPEGITQKQIDDEFLAQLQQVSFVLARPYWLAVRLYMRFVAKRG